MAEEDTVPSMKEIMMARRTAAFRFMLNMLQSRDEHPGADIFSANIDKDLIAANIRNDLSFLDRRNLVEALLQSFTPDEAFGVCLQFFDGAGVPRSGLLDDPIEDARFWAMHANARELRAYGMACAENMTDRTRAGFIEWLKKKHGGGE